MAGTTSSEVWHVTKVWLFGLCEQASRLALCIFPVFILLFFALLFSVWYLSGAGSYLIVIGAVLICAMLAAAVMFAIASLAIEGGRLVSPPPPWVRVAVGNGSVFKSKCGSVVPLRFLQMNTKPCSLSHGNETMFAVECFRVNCGACSKSLGAASEHLASESKP